MIKLFFAVFLFNTLVAYGNTLDVNNSFVSKMSGNYQTNYEDQKNHFTAELIYNNRNFCTYHKNFSTYSKSAFWSRFDIRNVSTTQKSLILRNLRAGTDYIDVYIYRRGALTQKIELGDMRPQKDRVILSPKSTFYLQLKPQETVTIVTHFKSYGSYDLEWEVLSPHHYSFLNSIEIWFWGIFGGVIIALIVYNTMMLFNLKKNIFFFYIVHSFLLLWFQYAYSGIIYFLNLNINLTTLTFMMWPVPHLLLVIMGIFNILFFEFHKRNKIITNLVKIIILFNLLASLFFFYAFKNSDVLLYSNYFLFLAFLTLLTYFATAIYAMLKKYSGAWYYLFGEGVYFFSLIYLTFVLSGKTPTGYLTYLVPIAALLEMIAFSIALGNWIKKLRIENQETHQLLLDEARFTAIGKNVGMAVHQWKDPLSQLSSHVIYLKAKEHTGELLPQDLSMHINVMEELIEHMKQTVTDIYESCSDFNSSRSFLLHESVDLAIRFLQDQLTLHNIDFQTDITENSVIFGSKNALTNVLMTLIDNSILQFQSTNTSSRKIKLSTSIDNQYISLFYEDNAGGISITPISDIFNTNKTTKGSLGMGVGLSLAKLMVEKRLSGKINVQNKPYGAYFEIILPKDIP